MILEMRGVSRRVDEIVYLADIDLEFEPGTFNVLLGRTLAGKTSLLRTLAGLDKPDKGKVLVDGVNVTNVPVQQRNVSMVYQQFINYPNHTVAENIAAPLKQANVAPKEITRRVRHVAELLHIEAYLDRYPLQLSGGQQQRCAMARALVKDAALVLFDEPLVNLDFKLRESLRSELKALFKARDSIAVYATTEAHEALALGGNTTLLHEGKVLQTGESLQQYRRPCNLTAANLYHEPPLNCFEATVSNHHIHFSQPVAIPQESHLQSLISGQYQFAIRADNIGLQSSKHPELIIDAVIDLAEISASETYLHISYFGFSWVVHLFGIHHFNGQPTIRLYFPLHHLFAFDLHGNALAWPTQLKDVAYGAN